MLQCARFCILFAVAAVCLSANAAQSTVYKVVDPEGKVTYQDHPPEPGAPAVERLQMRPDQNVLKSAPPADDTPPAEEAAAVRSDASSPEVRRREAAAIVEKALHANDAPAGESRDGASGGAVSEAVADSP